MATIRTTISTIGIEFTATCEACNSRFAYQMHVSGSAQGPGGGRWLGTSWEELNSRAAAELQTNLMKSFGKVEYPLRRCPKCEHVQSWMRARYDKVRRRLINVNICVPVYLKWLGGAFACGVVMIAINPVVGGLLVLAAPIGAAIPAALRRRALRRLQAALDCRTTAEAILTGHPPGLRLTKPDYRPGEVGEDAFLIRYEVRKMREELLGRATPRSGFTGKHEPHAPDPWRCSVCGARQIGTPGGPGEASSTLGIPLLWILGPLIIFAALWAYRSYRHHIRCVMCGQLYTRDEVVLRKVSEPAVAVRTALA